MTNFVQLYKSTDLNAPVLTGQVGSLITLLNKILVDGYTTASVTSLTESGTNYTAVLAVANTTLVVGNYITFAGATPGGANIAMRINTVTDPTHVICTGPGSLGAITGTLTYAKSPLAWAKAFAAGTNAQVYRSADTGSNRFYCQVIDNGGTAGGAKEAQVYGGEVMSADQTVNNGGGAGSGQFPTTVQYASGECVRKSTTADATARAWTMWGDDRTFMLVPNTGDTAGNQCNPMGFGHFISVKAGDGYNTFVGAAATFNSGSNVAAGPGTIAQLVVTPVTTTPLIIARGFAQTGTAVAGQMVGMGPSGISVIGGASSGSLTYPNPADSGLYVQPLLILDALGSMRGRMPGVYAPLHNAPLTNWDTATGVTGLSGVTLTAVTVTSGGAVGQVLVDTFGPWA